MARREEAGVLLTSLATRVGKDLPLTPSTLEGGLLGRNCRSSRARWNAVGG